MPLQIDWYVHYRVIDAQMIGVVTLDDVEVMSQRFVELLADAQANVPGRILYLLYDTTGVESMPPLYRMMKQALPVLKFNNRGPMFHATRNQTIRNIIDLAANITRFQALAFATREEAIRAIESRLALDNLAVTK